MLIRRGAFWLVLGLVWALPALAQQEERRPIEPEDVYRVQRVGNTALSPDGRHLLYTVQQVRQQENDRLTEIWWADLVTGRNQRLTTAGVNSTNPNWTPDGRRIYFTTTRGGERGLHFLNFNEPGGEAYRLPGLTGTPNFAPDGSWILLTRSVADSDDPGVHEADAELEVSRGVEGGRAALDLNWPGMPSFTGPADPSTRGRTEEERNRDVFVITHSTYKRDGTLSFIPPPRGGTGTRTRGPARYTQFFRIPADGLAEGEEPEQLTFDAVDKSFQAFSPDGSLILYTARVEVERDEDEEEDRPRREIGVFKLPVAGGPPVQVTTVAATGVRSVRMSPRGDRIAFVLSRRGQSEPILRVVDTSGEQIADVGEDWLYGIRDVTWTRDGGNLLWVSAIGGQDQVVSVPAGGGDITHVTSGRHTLSSVSFDAGMYRMAYVKSTPEMPWEAFIANIDGSDEYQVSRINTDWLEEVKVSQVEYFTYPGVRHNRDWLDQLPEKGVEYMLVNEAPEGERPEIDAWLVYPVDYEPGKKYPMVVSIHGGPHSRYSEIWFQEFQMLAAQGMFVLFTNPRGSSNYGNEFTYMTMRAWGIDDTKDILQAVDMVVERGLADPERLGICGGSYGGFMTNWITAHDDRFRAAITDRSISNWLSFYGVSDASGLVEREFGGRPWPFESTEDGSYRLVMMLSPIVWADRVQTPTMIIHSINDYRTPLEGGEQWFRALRKHDVEVRMVLFPDSSHGLSRTGEPWLLVRRLAEYRDWFREHLVDAPTVTAESAGG